VNGSSTRWADTSTPRRHRRRRHPADLQLAGRARRAGHRRTQDPGQRPGGTDYCIGFDTAVSIVAESLDRLYTTAASHHRVMVVETMDERRAGSRRWGTRGGADLIVIPEFPLTMDQIIAHLVKRRSSNNAFSIVVVAEGINLETLGCAVHDEVSTEASAACDSPRGASANSSPPR